VWDKGNLPGVLPKPLDLALLVLKTLFFTGFGQVLVCEIHGCM
jgi:hypothetical protein